MAALVLTFTASCNKEEIPDVVIDSTSHDGIPNGNTSGDSIFMAGVEQIVDIAKISYDANILMWQADDKVSVYDASTNTAEYGILSGANSVNAKFVKISGAKLDSGVHTAVCPASIRTGVNTINLPSTQNSSDGSLSELPLYAVGSSDSLMFYNLCGVVRLRLSAPSDVSVNSIDVETDISTNGATVISGSGTSVSLSTPGGSNVTTLNVSTPQSIASAHDFYMYLPEGSYSTFRVTVTASNSATCTKNIVPATSVRRGKITTITLSDLNFSGSLPGDFSVANGRTVKFSKGNLQYRASTGTWRFATHQYDYIGSYNQYISSSYEGWIDLFGWGTSGWSGSGAVCWQPWSTSSNSRDYYLGGSDSNSLTGDYAQADWGVYNAITGGGDAPGMWRTLTYDEWVYVLKTRSASTVNGVTDARYATATVDGKAGVILFPDAYSHPAGVPLPTNINTGTANFADNNYTVSSWCAMENAGAVFLPAAGYRSGTDVRYDGSSGHYWSSSYRYAAFVYHVVISGGSVNIINGSRAYVRSVRLVLI